MTSTELVRHEGNGAGEVSRDWIALLEPAAALANQVAGTGFVPSAMRGNPAAIVAAILYGDELGLGPMQSLAKIAVIEGKPTLYAEAQRALILRAGHEIRPTEATATRVVMYGKRADTGAEASVSWTLDDAKRANLAGRANWRTYPRQMLAARATAELARLLFADVIGGLAATEELEDVDPLIGPAALVQEATAPATPTRKRRRKSTALAAVETAEPATGEPAVSPDLPPLPGEPSEPPSEPAPESEPAGEPEPGESPAEAPADDQLEIGGSPAAEETGEPVLDDETTLEDSSAPAAEGSPVEKPPTKKQLDALDSLVGQQRETEVELPDGTTTALLSTEQVWAAVARHRNVDADTMAELLAGTDEAGVLHWAPLRDSLTRSEASDLMTKLVDRARKWGIE